MVHDITGDNRSNLPIIVMTKKCPECSQAHELQVFGNLDRIPIVRCPVTRRDIRVHPGLVGSVAPFIKTKAEHTNVSHWKRVGNAKQEESYGTDS